MLSEKVKYWFGDGEWDVDLMIRMGVVTEETILNYYKREVGDEIEENKAH